LKLAGSRKKLQLTWHSSQGQQNVVFPSDYALYYLHCYPFQSLEHVWLTIIETSINRISGDQENRLGFSGFNGNGTFTII